MPQRHVNDSTQRYRELAQWGCRRELNELDALMWRTERHPADSWTGMVVEILDATPDWQRFRRSAEWGLRMVPRFRERVVEPLVALGPPVWNEDPHFDLDYHVRRVRLPEPGTMRQLLDLAQATAMVPLDRTRPPWVRTLVEGLAGGRCALLLQAHHVLMDGMGYAQLMSRLYSATRDPPAAAGEPRLEGRHTGDAPAVLAAEQALALVRRAPRIASAAGRRATRALGAPRATAAYLDSLRRILTPSGGRGPGLPPGSRTAWRFGVLDCGVAELKAAGNAAGGSLNDAFVAVVLGAIRRYHERVGREIGDVRVSMPVSVRRPGDPLGGNRFAGAFLTLPTSIDAAAARIEAVHHAVDAVRSEPALEFVGHLTPAMNRAPSSLVAAAVHRVNATADVTLSNWPGVKEPVFVPGAAVERMFVFGPLPGTSMTAALNSHVGRCCIGLNVDGEVFRETDVLWSSAEDALQEVLEAGAPPPAPAGGATKASR